LEVVKVKLIVEMQEASHGQILELKRSQESSPEQENVRENATHD
jgi:hypothetical protein